MRQAQVARRLEAAEKRKRTRRARPDQATGSPAHIGEQARNSNYCPFLSRNGFASATDQRDRHGIGNLGRVAIGRRTVGPKNVNTYNQIIKTGKMKLFKSHNPAYKDGEQMRDFIYVKDVAEVCIFFMHHRKNSGYL